MKAFYGFVRKWLFSTNHKDIGLFYTALNLRYTPHVPTIGDYVGVTILGFGLVVVGIHVLGYLQEKYFPTYWDYGKGWQIFRC